MTRKPSDGSDRQSINVRAPVGLKQRLERIAAENGRSLAQEVERRLEQSLSAQPATAEDVRLMIREEIRAALAADRAAQAEASEILMRETVETMRVGMAAAERRAFTQSRPSNWVV